jgi:hypothetical protein
MIGNVPDLGEAVQKEVVVGRLQQQQLNSLLLAICYTCCNAISFEGIDMRSIANEIVN